MLGVDIAVKKGGHVVPGEIWKPIKGWRGLYEVSFFGRVRKLSTTISTVHGVVGTTKGFVLKQTPQGVGSYLRVVLC